MEDAITQFLAAVGVLFGAIITYVVVPFIRSKTTQQQRNTAYGIVQAGVGFAEQVGDQLGLDGESKKSEARDWIFRRFAELGINVESDELNGWIEDAVYHLDDEVRSLVEG